LIRKHLLLVTASIARRANPAAGAWPIDGFTEGEQMASARQKLNAVNCYGALIVAALVGLFFESLLVGFVTWVILLAGCLHDGSIRPGGRPK